MIPTAVVRLEETHYPLQLVRCPDCTLVQLSVVVDPAVVFPPDYPYSSGNSAELHRNFENMAEEFPLGEDDLVVDIGANDGTLLSKFQERYECRTVGVEPTEQVFKIKRGGWFQEFFSESTGRKIRDQFGPAKLVTASNVLAHVDDLNATLRTVRHLLAADGILVAENHNLRAVVDGQWDAVYHEHLRFFDQYSFYRVLHRHGLLAERWQGIPTHGGSFRAVASKRDGTPNDPMRGEYDWRRLRESARTTRAALRDAVGRYDGEVAGIGATARATTIINYCGFDQEDILWVCELPGSDKIGRYIPGTRIPVVSEQRLLEEDPPAAVLFSWHMADRIVPKLRDRGYEGDLIVPLPQVHHDDMVDVA